MNLFWFISFVMNMKHDFNTAMYLKCENREGNYQNQHTLQPGYNDPHHNNPHYNDPHYNVVLI